MSDPSSRVLTLLSLLQVPRDWPGDALADRLGVSARTVRRDVDRLRELGYRVDALRGPAGGYRLAAGTAMPPLLLDDDQAVALSLALAVAPASGADVAEASARALAVVRQVMPARLRHRTDALRVEVRPGAVAVDPEVLVAVSEAVRARHVLRVDVAPPPGREQEPGATGDLRPSRRIEPHALVARQGRWYLLARDPAVDDWRTFRVDRLTVRAPTRLPFVPHPVPGGDAAAFVDGLFRGAVDAGRSDAWPCTGTVVLRAPASRVAPFVGDDAVTEAVDASSCRLTLGSWSWTGLAARVAGLDAPFEVVGPDELRVAVRTLGERLHRAAGTLGDADAADADAAGRDVHDA